MMFCFVLFLTDMIVLAEKTTRRNAMPYQYAKHLQLDIDHVDSCTEHTVVSNIQTCR